MRIGVDACCWANGRGYGRFTRELLPRMVAEAPDDEWLCFADARAAARFDLRAPNVRLVEVAQGASPTEAAGADGWRSPLDMLRLSAAVARERPDVVFFPSVYTYFPLPPGTAAVVAIHDAIAERFPHLTLPTRRARLFWRGKVWMALRQARLVMTVSDFSARELGEVLRVARERVRVVGEAPAAVYRPGDPEEVRAAAARQGLPDGARWFVYVGGFNPHKRVDAALRAHAAVVREAEAAGEDAPWLLLVGTLDGDVFHGALGELRALAEGLGAGHRVRWTGWVDDEELRHLHSGAVALLLPSEAEGFGLPAVEAAACGAPVVATTRSPLPEVLEGGGVWVAPGDVDALADALRLLLRDEAMRRALGERARLRAEGLCWGRSARAALGALREAAA